MGGWLAGLDAFVTGLAYLGALLATRFVLRPLLLAVLGSAPFIGGWLSSHVDQAISDFERNINPAAEASLGILVSALGWLVTQGWNFANSAGDLAEGIYAWAVRVVTVTIPHAGSLTEQYLEGLIAAARGDALRLVQGAEADAQGLFNLTEADAVGLVGAARQDLIAEVSAAEAIVLAEVRKAEQNAGSLFQQAEYDAQQVAAAVEVRATALVDQAKAAASAGIGAVEHDLQALARATNTLVEDSVSVLGGDLSAAEARAQAALSGLEQKTQASIEGILSGLPWQALAAEVGVSEAVLQAEVRTLIGEGARAIRQEIGDAAAIRAKYGPTVRAALAQLRQGT